MIDPLPPPNARLVRARTENDRLVLDVALRSGLRNAEHAVLRLRDAVGGYQDDRHGPISRVRRHDGGLTLRWALPLATVMGQEPAGSLRETLRLATIELGGDRRARLMWDGTGAPVVHRHGRSLHLVQREGGELALAIVRQRRVPGVLGGQALRIGVLVHHIEAETGKTRALIDIAAALARRGHEVQLVVKWIADGRTRFAVPGTIGFLYAEGPFLLPPDGPADWRNAPDEDGRLDGLLATTRFDCLIHGGPGFARIRAALPATTRLVFSDHDGRRCEWLDRGRCEADVLDAFRTHDAIHVVNPAIAERVRQLTTRPVAAIPNELAVSIGAVDPATLFGARRFVAAGRFTRAKRMDHVVTAFAAIAKRLPGWRLDIYGTGDELPKVQAIAERLAGDRVTFKGFDPALREALAEGGVFVSASKYEAFGIALAEAMAAGCPVIAYDRAAGHRLLLDGGCGQLVDDADVNALAAAMLATAQALEAGDPALLLTAERARDRLAEFAPDRVTAAWGNFVERLCGWRRDGWLSRLRRYAAKASFSSARMAAQDRRSAAS